MNTFQDVVIAMVMGDNYDIAGFSTVSSRHNMVLPTYLLMKDSPAMSPRFHAICSRWLWAHARQVYSVGPSGYKDNTLAHIAFSQFLPTAMFPEFAGSKAWEQQFWPLFLKGWRRELLAANCHQQRTMAYHLNFVRRALPLLGLAKAVGGPRRFRTSFGGSLPIRWMSMPAFRHRRGCHRASMTMRPSFETTGHCYVWRLICSIGTTGGTWRLMAAKVLHPGIARS